MASEHDSGLSHVSVLLDETVESLAPERGGCYVDGTAGGGGHAARLLERAPEARLLAIDRDPDTLERLRERLAPFGDRAHVMHGRFDRWREAATALDWSEVDGVLLDLGFSSYQMDDARRGFSFLREGPLDMRMDRTAGEPAAALINRLSEAELTALLRNYGEEPDARRIARALVARRPLQTTRELAEVVSEAVPAKRRHGRIHPATLTFQALRIAVNDEVAVLERFLEDLPLGLKKGGRVAVISFHSLEDRRVKRRLRELARGCICPRDIPVCRCGRAPLMQMVSRRAITPSPDEVNRNPRARSARLRVAERI